MATDMMLVSSVVVCVCFFFFKQKTAYEMRISDWSSDVCSSDLTHPLQSLHREVNRLFDDVLRGFNMPAFAGFDRRAGWPHLELGETDKEIRVTAELPGLDEKNVEVLVEDGALTLRGEIGRAHV